MESSSNNHLFGLLALAAIGCYLLVKCVSRRRQRGLDKLQEMVSQSRTEDTFQDEDDEEEDELFEINLDTLHKMN